MILCDGSIKVRSDRGGQRNLQYMGGWAAFIGGSNPVSAVESFSLTIIHRRGGVVIRGGDSIVKLEM